ncbi:hypothetical protein XENOCAPTIV_020985, partial [Xenoophorus captivus]
ECFVAQNLLCLDHISVNLYMVLRYQLQPLAGPPGTDGPACTVTCSATTRLLQFSPGCDLPPPACSSSYSGQVRYCFCSDRQRKLHTVLSKSERCCDLWT